MLGQSSTRPPSAENVQWLDKNSKECPHCKNRIKKNVGCNQMTSKASSVSCAMNFGGHSYVHENNINLDAHALVNYEEDS